MKREIRVLGLDGCNGKRIVGVVLRGGLYLDGVFTLEKEAKASDLARNVTKTKYFPELKAIMIHGSTSELDAPVIQRMTALPVMTIPVYGQIDGQDYKRVRLGSRWVMVKTRMDSRMMLDILSLTAIRGHLPEPIRIAHLLGRLCLQT
jgi:endonuclease V-like protein UPF0215 family